MAYTDQATSQAVACLRWLVELKAIKIKIEAGTSTEAERERYNKYKESAWKEALRILKEINPGHWNLPSY